MAANYIVINSKFKPFSYAEMLQPVKAATEAHQKLEDEYADLATKANVWEGMANEQSDPYAYKMYKTYADDLEKRAGQLAREGLNPASRQEMLQMKQRYSSDIVPIEQAYKRRQELADAQREALTKDSTMMFSKNAASLSLDDLIKDPSLTYTPYSGATLVNQATVAAKNFAKDLRENPRKWSKILQGQYFETAMKTGFTKEEILKAIRGDEDASPILRKIMDDVVASSGIADWNDPNALRRAYEYVGQGIWSALGETTYDVKSNKAYDYAMQAAKSSKGDEPTPDNSLPYRTVPRTIIDPSVKTSQLDSDRKFLEEIIKDPSKLNKEVKVEHPEEVFYPGGTGTLPHYYPNQDRLTAIGNTYGGIKIEWKDGKLVGGNIQDIIDKINKGIASSAVREQIYLPNITDSSLMIKQLKENVRSIAGLSDNDDTGLRTIKGDKIGSDELNKYFTDDSNVAFDPKANSFYIISTNKDDETVVAKLDTEVFDDYLRGFRDAQNHIQKALQEGDTETANELIGYMMTAFLNKSQTMEKRQSTTTTKDM